jgi:ankyrin repeat protein/mono/diheme cytochrome c family protein
MRYALVVVTGMFIAGHVAGQPSKVDFRRDVLPIFRANCVGCHGPQVQQNGFRLDRRRDAMKGGTLAMIGPGNAAGSRLYMRLIGTAMGQQMPPTGALKPEQIATIRAWIDQGAEWPDDVSGETPAPPPDPKAAHLMDLLRAGDRAGFAKALASDPAGAKAKGPHGDTPLMFATLYADIPSMRLLLDKGADPNVRNEGGATALMWAADNLEKSRLLLDHKADVNARSDDGRTPLMIAAGIVGNTPVIKLLLDRGANPAVKAGALFGDTCPLTEAARTGNYEAMKMMIDHNADLKVAGPVAVALAMRARCDRCVDLVLKEPNPPVAIPAMFLVSPPLGPAFGVHPLLERGGNAKAVGPDGNSILHVAAASDTTPVEVVKALLDRGADVNAKGPGGETPLSLAKRHGHTPMVDLLMKAGAEDTDTSLAPGSSPKPAESTRAAVERTLPLLQTNDTIFLKKSGCISCHNDTLTAITLSTARKSGFKIDEAQVQHQVKVISTYLETWRDRLLQNFGIPGDVDTVAPILQALAAANYPPDAATDAAARFIKLGQSPDGHWIVFGNRPPLESTDIVTTSQSIAGLKAYAPKAQRAEYDEAIKRAEAWLAKAQPAPCTQDHAVLIQALASTGGSKPTIQKWAKELLAMQRPDGGWAQIATLNSDAYATGQALTALLESGSLKPSDASAKRATQFLLNSQYADGSWFVRTRAIPIQPYFETGFPYGHDQWISTAATNWATTALALASR